MEELCGEKTSITEKMWDSVVMPQEFDLLVQ